MKMKIIFLLSLFLLSSCSFLDGGIKILLGNMHFNEGLLDEALAEYLSAGVDSHNGMTAYNIANAFSLMGQDAAAEDFFTIATRSTLPDVAAAAWYNSAYKEYSQNNFEEALKLLRNAIELRPKDYRLIKAYELVYFSLSRADSEKSMISGQSREGDSSALTEAMNLSRRAEDSPFTSTTGEETIFGDH